MPTTVVHAAGINPSDMIEEIREVIAKMHEAAGSSNDGIIRFVSQAGPNAYCKQRGPGFTRPAAGTRGKHGKRRGRGRS